MAAAAAPDETSGETSGAIGDPVLHRTPGTLAFPARCSFVTAQTMEAAVKGIIAWFLGIPLVVIILFYLIGIF